MACQLSSSGSGVSCEHSSKPREPLSITVPSPHLEVEHSRFSPESPTAPSRSRSARTDSTAVQRDVEAAMSGPRPPRFRDRLSRRFFDMRMMRRFREPDIVPIQPARLPSWSPLHIEKRQHCCEHCPSLLDKKRKRKKKQRDRTLVAILVILLFCLLGNTVFLDVHTLRSTVALPSDEAVTNTSTGVSSSTLSAQAQQCLSQYIINAPSDPASYPCSTCYSVLRAVPSNFSDGNPQDPQQIENAIQFCGLRSIFDIASTSGQAGLSTGGWVKDVRFCVWSGVSCDGAGRVSSLELTFPSVPATFPEEIGGLTGMQSLQVIGDTNVPAGALPSSFTSLTSLSTLHLESTAISALPDSLFSSLNKVATLTLVRNTQMGAALPSSLSGLSLQNLVVNSQPLDNPLQTLASSASLQPSMKLIDLSSTSLNGTVPSTISAFSALTELHLDDNNLSAPLPSAFPPELQALTLANNTGLAGSVAQSSALCVLAALKDCDLRGSGLTGPSGGCGVCQFK